MRIADLMKLLQPGERLYISFDTELGSEEERKWIGPLSVAQMYAYYNHKIGPMNNRGGNIYCIIYS